MSCLLARDDTRLYHEWCCVAVGPASEAGELAMPEPDPGRWLPSSRHISELIVVAALQTEPHVLVAGLRYRGRPSVAPAAGSGDPRRTSCPASQIRNPKSRIRNSRSLCLPPVPAPVHGPFFAKD